MRSPYLPLEVVDAFHKVDGPRWFVRDDEESQFWLMVETVERRLTCWCDDGIAHAEAPDTEPECVHTRAVVDHRGAERAAKGKPLGILVPATFVD